MALPTQVAMELRRVGAEADAIRRDFRCEEAAAGRWTLSCRTARRFGAKPDEVVATLRALPSSAGWRGVWLALFDYPESPF